MGTVKIKHLVERNGAFYFQATPAMRQAGVFSEPLGQNRVKAIERAEFLNAEWDAARVGATPKTAARGTINWLARDFQESEWYRVLKPVTQVEADFHLAIILNAPIAKYPAHAITRRHCRQFHNKLVQAKGRPNANKSMKWLRRLMSYAVEIGLRETNPALRMGLKHNPPREETWTVAEIEAFKRTAVKDGKRAWALAVHLGYDTSQRLSDWFARTQALRCAGQGGIARSAAGSQARIGNESLKTERQKFEKWRPLGDSNPCFRRERPMS